MPGFGGGPGITRLTTSPGGYGFPYTVHPGQARGSDVVAWGGVNQCMYFRVSGSGPVSKIGLHIGTSSGNLSVAVYTGSGSGRSNVPSARVQTSGALASPGTGYREIALGASVYVNDGDWFAVSADNTSITFLQIVTASAASDISLGASFLQASAHPAPNPAASLTATTGRLAVLVGVP